MPDPATSKQHVFQPPSGTRDLYPIEAARRRYITEAWRRVSINHGFEEIDGPTFEHLDLYKVKSGEGIVNELFAFTRAGGEKDYALRPEFTPTLARMYAAKAASLPKPTKWFTTGPFFRAERPQRGRLREFLQWNCDVLADPSPLADAELIACCVDLLRSLGLSSKDVQIRLGHRSFIEGILRGFGVDDANLDAWFNLLDRVPKIEHDAYLQAAVQLRTEKPTAQRIKTAVGRHVSAPPTVEDEAFQLWVENLQQEWEEAQIASMTDEERARRDAMSQSIDSQREERFEADYGPGFRKISTTLVALAQLGISDWVTIDIGVVRGLAYYTGMVFEVIVDNERAVAGGGRYDNLIELFGGPSTPAVGFGMGDVVLSLVLQDKGLMPSDAELMGHAGQSPDAFVISNGTPEADAALPKVLADLRRAAPLPTAHSPLPSSRGLHARRSYKTTKNVGKLLQDASKANARFAVIIESATEATIKNLATGEQDQNKAPLDTLAAEIRKRLGH